ncbi:hypothetical protein E2C01_003318 [Portunus trituberculatus]|uniref:Uncharacterized protein n=1 Tax=Portunus trituberculatus TaxID=210409 RepID=A0A5B7CNJ8_PORTR|nr:hypothetical protein [Portunus trituberculatus]
MEGPPLTPGVNIHLQTLTKVDVYPVPQEGQQGVTGGTAAAAQHQQQCKDEDTVMDDVDTPWHGS